MFAMSEPLKRFTCPACNATSAILTVERFGTETVYCPDREHSWDEHKPPTP
jgi:hypothetical protein